MVVTISSMSDISGGVYMNLIFGILEPPKNVEDHVLSLKIPFMFFTQMLFQHTVFEYIINCMVLEIHSYFPTLLMGLVHRGWPCTASHGMWWNKVSIPSPRHWVWLCSTLRLIPIPIGSNGQCSATTIRRM